MKKPKLGQLLELGLGPSNIPWSIAIFAKDYTFIGMSDEARKNPDVIKSLDKRIERLDYVPGSSLTVVLECEVAAK